MKLRYLALVLCWLPAILNAQTTAQANAPAAAISPASASAERLQQFIEQSRRNAAAAKSPAELQALLRQRQELLTQGEAALVRGDTAAAQSAFDKAALIEHAADTEMALVRSYMQAGEYRRAASFAAHTAGAHRQVAAGAVLYAWLLRQGGQEAAAKQLLETAVQTFGAAANNPALTADEKKQTLAADAQLQAVQRLIAQPGGLPSSAQLALPARLAPYATGSAVPRGARVLASGVLLAGGRQALVPLPALGSATSLWLRNGLGQTRRASLAKRLPALGLALLNLESPLPYPSPLPVPLRDPFPGSPAYALHFAASPLAEAAWPRIYTGLQGIPVGDSGLRELGMDLPNATPGGPVDWRGGPLLDAAGRWVGVVRKAADGKDQGKDQVVMASQLRSALGALLDGPAALPAPGATGTGTAAATAAASVAASVPAAASAGAARAPLDEVYENALRMGLQVIAKPK